MTSGGSRRDSSRLGFANRGLPRRTNFGPRRRSASSIHSSVISGASSLLEMRPEVFRFALMTVPHADDSPGGASRCPNEHNQTGIQPTGRDVSGFAVIDAIVDPRKVQPGENFPSSAHVQASLLQRLQSPRLVSGNAHLLNVATLNRAVKYQRDLRQGGRFRAHKRTPKGEYRP